MFDKNLSKTTTMSRLFVLKILEGKQPYLPFLDANRAATISGLFLDTNKTTTISGLFWMPVGQQLYLGFFRC